jgi:hypothetical protein
VIGGADDFDGGDDQEVRATLPELFPAVLRRERQVV